MSTRIQWSYRHYTNSRSSFIMTREGEYFGKIKHTYKHWYKRGSKQMALVKFDLNKGASKVPFDELTFMPETVLPAGERKDG